MTLWPLWRNRCAPELLACSPWDLASDTKQGIRDFGPVCSVREHDVQEAVHNRFLVCQANGPSSDTCVAPLCVQLRAERRARNQHESARREAEEKVKAQQAKLDASESEMRKLKRTVRREGVKPAWSQVLTLPSPPLENRAAAVDTLWSPSAPAA